MEMNAIKVTRQNIDYVMNYGAKDAPWAADLVNVMETNLANGEWTYVYTILRRTSSKTCYYHMTETKFNETFKFTAGESPYLVMPITAK